MNQYGCYEFYVPWTTNELESGRTSLKRAASSKAAVVSLAKALADELLDYLADASTQQSNKLMLECYAKYTGVIGPQCCQFLLHKDLVLPSVSKSYYVSSCIEITRTAEKRF
jgi:hypothetical protein